MGHGIEGRTVKQSVCCLFGGLTVYILLNRNFIVERNRNHLPIFFIRKYDMIIIKLCIMFEVERLAQCGAFVPL